MRTNTEAFAGLGDLVDHCKRLISVRVTGGNIQAIESILLKVRALEDSLGIDDASPTERLLIEQVSVAWLGVYHSEFVRNHDRDSKADEKYFEARLEKAQKRYANAVLNLERLRAISEAPPKAPIPPRQESSSKASPTDGLTVKQMMEKQTQILRELGIA